MAATIKFFVDELSGLDAGVFFPGLQAIIPIAWSSNGTTQGSFFYSMTYDPSKYVYYIDVKGTDIVADRRGISGDVESIVFSVSRSYDAPKIALAHITIDSGDGPKRPMSISDAKSITPDSLVNSLYFAEPSLQMIGNQGSDKLYGSQRGDLLDGKGGADVMKGKGGNDVYGVNHVNDQVIEAAGEGSDTVVSTISYGLAAGQEIETLQLASSTGSQALTLSGNEFANTLRGNAGANVLNGRGGADQMYGGAGDDTYAVDNAADRVFEAAGQGTDTVVSTISYVLSAGQSVETLQFASSTGAKALNLTGNEGANTLRGNAGSNVLDGGLGGDTLTGNAGADSFVFRTALGAANVDHITDFVASAAAVHDTIQLSKSVFTALSAGPLAAAAFKDLSVAGARVDADDRIVYNKTTGALSYDADGSGAKAAVQFAIIDNKAALGFQDILIVA